VGGGEEMDKKQQVLEWWSEAMQFRHNNFEAKERFREQDYYHTQKGKQDAWYAGLHALINQCGKCFLGYMTREEVDAQEKFLAKFHLANYYFLYLSGSPGEVVVSRSLSIPTDTRMVAVVSRRLSFQVCDEIENLVRIIANTRAETKMKSLDRGKALIYRKEVNQRARVGVDTWTMVAARAGVPKDIRLLVAKMIWDGRCEWMI